MNPAKRVPVAIVTLLALAAWFNPWFPAGLATTKVTLSRYYAALPEVNLPDDRVLAAMRLLDENGHRPPMDRWTHAEIAESLREIHKPLTGEQIGSIARAMLQSPPSASQNLRPLGRQAWRLFVLFVATIVLILMDAMPVFACAIGGLGIAILTGILTPAQGFSGFSNSTIILIVVAFAIARGVDNSGLGRRVAYLIIRKFGSSTLGLGYSLVVTDALIAPAFPSNTARSGVLYPIVHSVAQSAGSSPKNGTRTKLGAYLVMNSIAGLTISSAMWLTAMAANPMGVSLANGIDPQLTITFGSWFAAASLPSVVALIAVPYLLYRVFPPEVKQTPEAPEAARSALETMGPPSRDELVMAGVFVALITCWALSNTLGLSNTAVALFGLFVLMLTHVIKMADIRGSNGPVTFVWFGTLFTLSTYLDKFGLMEWVGNGVGNSIIGWSWPVVYVVLLIGYVLIHYFFVSQTAHMVAVFPIFLKVGLTAGVPSELLAMMLLLATNFFSAITPQASSANAIFIGSEYVTPREVYVFGGYVTVWNTLIFGVFGTAWIWMLFEFILN